MRTAPILARIARSARRAGQKLGLVDAPISAGTVTDFRNNYFGFAQRRMSPQLVRVTLEQATAGNLTAQWELFALMEDSWPRLAKNLAEVRRAAARATFAVQPYAERGTKPGESAKERAALVEQSLRQWWPRPGTLELSFEDTLFHALDAYGKGISVLEVQWQQVPAGILPRCAHVLAPQRYGWNADGTELGLLDPVSRAWVPFAQDHFFVGLWQARTGAPGATAVLRALAPYWVGITFGWEWLLSTAQLFGVPFRWATFDKNYPELGEQLRDMLAAMGASGYGAFPEGTKLEFMEAAQQGQNNPQVMLQALADKACDLLILGQELSGGAQAAGLGGGAAGLQESVRADRLQAAAQWCADLLNYQLVPAVLRANWGNTDEPPTIVPDVDDEPDPLSLAQRDQLLLQAGVDLPRTWFYERHGIPEPIDGEAVIGSRAAPAPEIDFEPPEGPEHRPEAMEARQRAMQRTCKAIVAKSKPGATGLAPSFRTAGLREAARAQAEEVEALLAKVEAALAIEEPAARAAALRTLQAALPAEVSRISPDSPLAQALTDAASTAAVAGAVEQLEAAKS